MAFSLAHPICMPILFIKLVDALREIRMNAEEYLPDNYSPEKTGGLLNITIPPFGDVTGWTTNNFWGITQQGRKRAVERFLFWINEHRTDSNATRTEQ